MSVIVDTRRVGRDDGKAPSPRYCVLSGDDCWGMPHVRISLRDGWYCYASAHAWNSATDEARAAAIAALRAQLETMTDLEQMPEED